MKHLLLASALLLSACVTDTTGHKRYVGPTLNLNLGFNGASIGIGIVGDPTLPVITASNPNGKPVVTVKDK